MRVGTLQFAPDLSQVKSNIAHADELLKSVRPTDLQLLVLPELAFTGYNYSSLQHILPFLEPTAAGPSTAWARSTAARLKCIVTVGYPEIQRLPDSRQRDELGALGKVVAFNSTVTVAPTEQILAHYRKTHLYYTDESWAQESPDGWLTAPLALAPHDDNGSGKGQNVEAAFGICMDLNPHKFLAPWTAYEFSNAALDSQADLLILSMAWLTGLPSFSLQGSLAKLPDTDALTYWIDRLTPIVNHGDREVIVVCANRCGTEEGQNPCGQEAGVRYAGTSWIGRIGAGQVKIWRVMGRGEHGVCIADTETEPQLSLVLRERAEEDGERV